MTDVRIEPLRESDLPTVLELNNDAVPATSELTLSELSRLWTMTSYALMVRPATADSVIGFCLNLDPGAEYASLNYRWFADRYDSFTYLDRIVVHRGWRDRGIGAALYADLEQRIDGRVPMLCCEVNIKPMNEASLRFHHRIGFVEVGQQDTDGGNKRVSLLAKRL